MFTYSTESLGWDDHRELAIEWGGELASVHNVAEVNYIVDITNGANTILGGKRIDSDPENWEWSDGSAWDYEPWNDGEPNNYLGSETEYRESVVEIRNEKFNDIPRSDNYREGAVYKRNCRILEIIFGSCSSLMNNEVFTK